MKKERTEVTGQVIAEQRRYLNVKQAATYMSMAVWAIRQLIWSRQLPVVKVGKSYIIDQTDLDKWSQVRKLLCKGKESSMSKRIINIRSILTCDGCDHLIPPDDQQAVTVLMDFDGDGGKEWTSYSYCTKCLQKMTEEGKSVLGDEHPAVRRH